MPLIWKSTDIPEDVTTKIISFHFEELKFETIFRNNFILETWRPLTGTNVELDFVHHISAPSAFLFSEAKVPNFWKDKGQTFSETETLSWIYIFIFVLELYFLLMNVQEGLSISKAEERRFPWKQRCFTYSSASRQFIMNCDLWNGASRDTRPLVILETTRCKCFSVRGCIMWRQIRCLI